MIKKVLKKLLDTLRKKNIVKALVNEAESKHLGEEGEFKYYIEEFNYYNKSLFIKGWVFSKKSKIEKIGFVDNKGDRQFVNYELLGSRDIVDVFGSVATNARFSLSIHQGLPEDLLNMCLVFETSENSCTVNDLWKFGFIRGVYGTFIPDFFSKVTDLSTNPRVLEIGSRARSGVSNKDFFITPEMDYVGTDIKKGQDVDIVCDAHKLSKFVDNESFDCVYSLNTFEHLLMPWKVALEINKVLKHDGLVLILTHQSFPLHDTPWDFWRYSDNAWLGIFNKYSGFEIIETAYGDPVRIVPKSMHAGTIETKEEPAYIHSIVIARKISTSVLSWDVEVEDVLQALYPE